MKNVSLVTALFLFSMPIAVSAATLGVAQTYDLGRGQSIVGNLYAVGSSVDILGTVAGDIVGAGGTILVSGAIERDALAAGGTIVLSGPVNGSARLVGGSITAAGPISGDLAAAGGQIAVTSGASVGGDFLAAGGSVTQEGAVQGKEIIRAGRVMIDGPVNGDVNVTANTLIIGDHAVVNGVLNYTSPKEAQISTSALIKGGVHYTQTAHPMPSAAAFAPLAFGLSFLARFLMSLVAAFILGYGLRRLSTSVVLEAVRAPWREMLAGFLVLVALPIAALIALITIVGIPIGFIAIFIYIALLILSFLYAPIILGSWIAVWLRVHAEHIIDWKSILLGVVGVAVLNLIPIVGSLAHFLVVLLALGVLAKLSYDAVLAREMR